MVYNTVLSDPVSDYLNVQLIRASLQNRKLQYNHSKFAVCENISFRGGLVWPWLFLAWRECSVQHSESSMYFTVTTRTVFLLWHFLWHRTVVYLKLSVCTVIYCELWTDYHSLYNVPQAKVITWKNYEQTDTSRKNINRTSTLWLPCQIIFNA